VLCDRALRVLVVRPKPARIDFIGAALLTGGVTCWLLVLSWGGTELPWTSPQLLGLFALGAALLLALAWQERRAPDPLLPPRLFANRVVVSGVAIGFFASMALFGATFLLPLFFQLVGGADAASSGLLVVPFLGSNCIGAFAAGTIARRVGRTRALIAAGVVGCIAGFALLATLGPTTPEPLSVLYQLILGISVGVIMPTSLVATQNAAERRDVGVATGMLLFLRSMGGAFGSTLVGAILASRLPVHVDLSHGAGLAHLPAATGPALTGAFHLAFLVCAVLMGVACVVVFRMRDLPLRTSSAQEPAALAH
jgi:MFS family permease